MTKSGDLSVLAELTPHSHTIFHICGLTVRETEYRTLNSFFLPYVSQSLDLEMYLKVFSPFSGMELSLLIRRRNTDKTGEQSSTRLEIFTPTMLFNC